MKAAVRRKYGPPNQIQIEDIQRPLAKQDEVLVEVRNTTVNRTDCANLTAKPFLMRFVLGFLKPGKYVLGTDFAGEVVGIGRDVTSFVAGDRVFGFRDTGAESQAEYMALPADSVFLIPENISYREAAASLEGAHYAYTFLHKVKLRSGQTILINGASGGIGSALLQFVKNYDVKVVATCDTKNVALMASLGADRIYDFTKEDFTRGKERYDFIFDAVGKSTFGRCKHLLKDNGVYVSSELGPFMQNLFYPILTKWSRKKVVFPVPYPADTTIPYISGLLEKGKFVPVIDREYGLKEIAQAYGYVIKGQKTGNVVIDVCTHVESR